jgi:hypothetical protein
MWVCLFDSSEVMSHLHLWKFSPDSDMEHSLGLALNAETVSQAVVAIVLDLSQPWSSLSNLERYIGLIRAHLDSLRLPREQKESMNEAGLCLLQLLWRVFSSR